MFPVKNKKVSPNGPGREFWINRIFLHRGLVADKCFEIAVYVFVVDK